MRKRWPALLALALLLAVAGAAEAQEEPSLLVDPASQTIEPEAGAFEVRILVDDITADLGLSGYTLVVRYDPGVVHALAVDDSGFLASAGSPTTCPESGIDNDAGRLEFFCFTSQISSGPGAQTSEPQLLASITFEPRGEGLTLLDISQSSLIDDQGNDLAISIVNGEVTVGFRSPAQDTPGAQEPASDEGGGMGLLIGLGIAGLAIVAVLGAAAALRSRRAGH
ncbi:MAG: hypothetical protein IIB19_06505 [Chloroflexi bacterium]|nr:hypothetical protein [Chloroflexota bacterium]